LSREFKEARNPCYSLSLTGCATVGSAICATVRASVGATVLDARYARGAAINRTNGVRVRVARCAAVCASVSSAIGAAVRASVSSAIGAAVRATVGAAVLDARDSFVGTGVRGALQVVDAACTWRCFAH
jgi:hypothetical protein